MRAFWQSWLPGFRLVLLSWAIACGAVAGMIGIVGLLYGKPTLGFSFAGLSGIVALACLFAEAAVDRWLTRSTPSAD